VPITVLAQDFGFLIGGIVAMKPSLRILASDGC
jgi:hypothetical protein